MANTKSIQKVKDYLEKMKKGDFVSITQISKDAVLNYRSVKQILEILKENGKINTASTKNGTTLIQYIGGENAI